LARNFNLALQIIKKAFNNFPSELSQIVLRFNYGLANIMLQNYDEAIRSYLSILIDCESQITLDLKQYSVHNLIIAVGLRNDKEDFSNYKELVSILGEIGFTTLELQTKAIKLQKLVAFVKANANKDDL
jgi:tetratricopeptide (TPR) repeat protein